MRGKRLAAFAPIALVAGGLAFGSTAVGARSPAPGAQRAPTSTAAGFTLKIVRTGEGEGTVSSRPTGIDCPSTCSHSFAGGKVVRLRATPEEGSFFAGWTDCSKGSSRTQAYVSPRCQVTMSKARTVKASFRAVTKNLVVRLAGSGDGMVKSSPAGISCGKQCKHGFAEDKVVKLIAVPAAGSVFVKWKASCEVKSNRAKAYVSSTCSIAMGKKRVVMATFKATKKKKHSSHTGKKHKKKKKKQRH